jgi:hypothetical protein
LRFQYPADFIQIVLNRLRHHMRKDADQKHDVHGIVVYRKPDMIGVSLPCRIIQIVTNIQINEPELLVAEMRLAPGDRLWNDVQARIGSRRQE